VDWLTSTGPFWFALFVVSIAAGVASTRSILHPMFFSQVKRERKTRSHNRQKGNH
jgi:hypothetical protein